MLRYALPWHLLPCVQSLSSSGQSGAEWRHIHSAETQTEQTLARLATAFGALQLGDDVAVVAFGSLARREATQGSDTDWTLLLDGRAMPEHFDVAQRVRDVIDKLDQKRPGREGVFGTMAVSHDLVHQIGGEDDSNSNTTRRVLLLLESVPLAPNAPMNAHERVVRQILKRYIKEDLSFVHGNACERVPRFLLNDIARYWRTLCVDFAYKMRDRARDGWALRNLKLRMARKLLFASGLLTCFDCRIRASGDCERQCCKDSSGAEACVDCLRQAMKRTPLDVLALTALRLDGQVAESAKKAVDAYDSFLGMLNDSETRKGLGAAVDIDHNSSFQEGRRLSHEFRDGLQSLFFASHSELTKLTKKYGVF